jgi:hypothetical protein
MSVELNIGQGLATLKVNLGEFLAVARQIAGITKHKEARQALKDSIVEIRKSCDTAVDVFTPLYALTSQAIFEKDFGSQHAAFKNAFLKNVDNVRTHCHVVKSHLDELLLKKSWMGKLPLLERSHQRLDELCKRWLFSDYALTQQMKDLLQNIDELYTELARMTAQDVSAAFAMLRSSLAQLEDDFLSLRKQLNELDLVGRTL